MFQHFCAVLFEWRKYQSAGQPGRFSLDTDGYSERVRGKEKNEESESNKEETRRKQERINSRNALVSHVGPFFMDK